MSDDPMSGSAGARSSVAGEPYPSVYEASQTIRSLILFVLLFAAYLLTVIWSTTDMMFLRGGEIILPIIPVGVPLVEFYIFAPVLFFLLHLNLLIKLRRLAREICNPPDNTRAEPRNPSGLYEGTVNVLLPIYPVRLMKGMREATPKKAIFSVLFFILVGTIPLLVLLYLQAHFLAYQSEKITFFHQLIVTADLSFQFLFMLSYNKLWRDGKKFLRRFSYFIESASIIGPLLFVWMIALVPNSDIENKFKSNLQQSLAGCFFVDWWKNPEDQLFQCAFIKGERYIDVQNEYIRLRKAPPAIVGALIQFEKSSTPTIPCEHVGRLDLSDRHLHYANFSNSTIQCAKMERTQLHGAKLFKADLSGEYLGRADLSGANLRATSLLDARLSGADLSGADLSAANLSGADLSGAKLFKANFSSADLRDANLSGADLLYARLYGANLVGTELDKTTLSNTYLYGADLSGAQLRNVDLRRVNGKIPDEAIWNDILENIRQGLRAAGFSEDEIAARLIEIEDIGASPPGFVLPSQPPAANCVFHPDTPPFADWKVSEECVDPMRP